MSELLLIAGAAAVAGLLQGAVGFGFGLLALAVLSDRMSVHDATALLAPAGLAVNLAMLAGLRRHFRLDRMRLLLGSVLAGVPFGVLLLMLAQTTLLRVALVVILFATVAQHLHPSSRSRRWPVWLGVPCGLVSGALSGIFGTGGPPTVAYVHGQRFDRLRYAASVQAALGLGTALRLPGLVATGLFAERHLRPGLIALAAALAGTALGVRVLHRFSNRTVSQATVALLALLGLRHLLILLREWAA